MLCQLAEAWHKRNLSAHNFIHCELKNLFVSLFHIRWHVFFSVASHCITFLNQTLAPLGISPLFFFFFFPSIRKSAELHLDFTYLTWEQGHLRQSPEVNLWCCHLSHDCACGVTIERELWAPQPPRCLDVAFSEPWHSFKEQAVLCYHGEK